MADSVNVGAAAPKVARRGVAAARGTQRLKFTHNDAQANGLFVAHLDSVDVSMIKIGEETTGMPSFNGLEIPKIRFTFASNEVELNKRKYVTLQFNAVESNVDTIPGGKSEWKVNTVLDWFKHILNVYVLKGRELTDEEAELLSLPFVDFDEQGAYVPLDVETIIAGWKTLFENVANILTKGNGGSEYFMSNGKPLPIWLKLIRYIKSGKKGWTAVTNGDLSVPTFVGEGCIELFKANSIPAIHLNPITECITPKNLEKEAPKAPNMGQPGYPAAPGFGGVALGGGFNPGDAFGGGVPSDMPFSDDLPE